MHTENFIEIDTEISDRHQKYVKNILISTYDGEYFLPNGCVIRARLSHRRGV